MDKKGGDRSCRNFYYSKLFVSVAIMQLNEKGYFSIYDDISLYLNYYDLKAWGYDSSFTKFCPKLRDESFQ